VSTPKVTSAHPVVLTIAGSDPSGGAGLQADLRTFAALGAQGTSVVTALTAQNTTTVAKVYPVEPEVVLAQLTTLLDDVHVDAVKVGMLATARTVLAITPILAALPASGVPVVLDPVLTSTTGTRLLDEEAVHALRELARLVDVVTPNLAEAAGLVGAAGSLDTVSHLHVLARQGRELGIPRLLVTGGHLHGRARPSTSGATPTVSWSCGRRGSRYATPTGPVAPSPPPWLPCVPSTGGGPTLFARPRRGSARPSGALTRCVSGTGAGRSCTCTNIHAGHDSPRRPK